MGGNLYSYQKTIYLNLVRVLMLAILVTAVSCEIDENEEEYEIETGRNNVAFSKQFADSAKKASVYVFSYKIPIGWKYWDYEVYEYLAKPAIGPPAGANNYKPEFYIYEQPPKGDDISLEEYAKDHIELAKALEKWGN